MTIKDMKVYDTVKYEGTPYGTVFFHTKSGCHYLAIPEVDDRTKPKIYNAFNLELNNLVYIDYDDEIIIRDAELHLI